MKITIIGAGAVSSALSYLFNRDKSVSRIICATNDLERAKDFIFPQWKKTRLVLADASKIHEIVRASSGSDLIINASLPEFNENIMESALTLKTNYQDMASSLHDLKNAEQLRFHSRFKKAKLIGLINTGAAPGITNMLAREAADQMDEVQHIKLRLLEEQKTNEMIFSWSVETLLDELTSPPLIFKNGKFKLTKPFGNPEKYEFPHPFGTQPVCSIYGDEVATIPHYIKTRNLDYKSAGTDIDFSKVLFSLGLFKKKPVFVNGNRIIPVELFKKLAPKVPTPNHMMYLIKKKILENAFLVIVVDVTGKKSKKLKNIKISAMFPDLLQISKKLPGSTYISYPTGIAAYAMAKIIPKIKKFGVFPPETFNDDLRKTVLQELENHGITITRQSTGRK